MRDATGPTVPDGGTLGVADPSANARVPRVDVVCTGEPGAMGYTQGATLRPQVAGVWRALSDLEAFRMAQPLWMPLPVFRRLAERKARRLWTALERDFPRMAVKLEGLASGSSLRRGSLWLLNALEPLLSTVGNRAVVPVPGACSALAVRGRRSATGDPVVARNFDYLPLVQPFYVVRENRPESGYRSLDFTIASLVGAVDGMNEHGLCVTYDYAFMNDRATFSGTISMAVSTVLESCRTVDEAVETLRHLPRWGGGILMLADATGDIASMELSNTRTGLRRPSHGEDVLYHSNQVQDSRMREVQVDAGAVFTTRAPRALHGRRVLASSEVRDARFAELLSDDRALSADDLQSIMSDHGAEGCPGDTTICVHGSYWFTTASLQFFPRTRRVRIAYDTTCNAEYQELGL